MEREVIRKVTQNRMLAVGFWLLVKRIPAKNAKIYAKSRNVF